MSEPGEDFFFIDITNQMTSTVASMLLIKVTKNAAQHIDSMLTLIHIAEKHNAPLNAAHLRAAALALVDVIEQNTLASMADEDWAKHLKEHPEGRVAHAAHMAALDEYRKLIAEDSHDCGEDHDEG